MSSEPPAASDAPTTPVSGSASTAQPSAVPPKRGLEAARVFPLHNPIPGNEKDWHAYALNRYRAIKVSKTMNVFPTKKGYESPDSDGDDFDFQGWGQDHTWVLRSIRRQSRKIEEELGYESKVLQSAMRVLYCDASFEEMYDPQTVDVMTRLYSPTTPSYIDVHLQYHCRSRLYEIEWHYTLGYKLHKRPKADAPDAKALRAELGKGIVDMHIRNGWRPICWGMYSQDNGNFGKRWRRIEEKDFLLDSEGLMDIHEALFGPTEALSEDANEDAKIERRKALVRTFRIVLAAVGIDYNIACTDDEEDESPGSIGSASGRATGPVTIEWYLEGVAEDNWVARGARKAAGFQLSYDAENEAKGQRDRKELAEEEPDAYYDEFDDEEPGGCPNQ